MSNAEWGAIPRSLATDVSTMLNKKLGVSTGFKPSEWKDNMNLLGKLTVKTASGAIASFSDGADAVPLKSGVFGITPTLTGVSGMTISHSGKNVFDITTYPITTGKAIRTSDGGFVNSTVTNRGATQGYISCVSMRGKTWVINKPNQTGNSVGLAFYDENNGFLSAVQTYPSGTNGVFTVPNNAYSFRFTVDLSSADDTEIQIEAGSTATTYEPYTASATHAVSFGSTVYGGSVDVVNGTGTETWRKIVIDGDTVKCNGIYGANGNALPRLIMDAEYYHSGVATDILSTYLTPSSSVINDEDSVALVSSGTSIAVHIGTIQGNDGTHGYNSSAELLAAANAYLQSHNLTVVYKLSDANATDFTFTPVPINSRLGSNNLWCDTGDTDIEYRSSGTETIIAPVLTTKTITENGTYSAEDDNADGYDEVTVNVVQNIETVLSSNPLIEVTGVSGTDVSRTMWTYTATSNKKIVFHANTQVKTNTGANDGYFTVKKNDTVIATTYANTSTTTSLPIPDIDVEVGDVVTIIVGFDNYHTSCWFDIYSTITLLS